MRIRDFLTSLMVMMASLCCNHAQTMPTGCSYDSGLYTCDCSNLTSNNLLPLQVTSFNPVPQRLRLNNLPTSLSTAILHENFQNISTGDYDNNYPATLELECTHGSAVSLTSGFLNNSDYVRDFKILNCALGDIPAAAFSGLNQLDRFTIENGSISSMDAAMLDGVTIYRNTTASYPEIHGEFAIKNTAVSGAIPATLFNQTTMYSLVLRNLGLTSLNTSMFAGCPNIRHLDLSYNSLTEFPGSELLTLQNLGTFRLYGTDIDGCTCAKLDFFKLQTVKYVEVLGDIVCTNTTNYENKLALQFFMDNCKTVAATCSNGVVLLDSCLTPIDLTGYSLGLVSFILGWVVLGLTIHTRKSAVHPAPGGKKPGNKTKLQNFKEPASKKARSK